MMPSATPDAERTPPTTSTNGRRSRRWRRGSDAPPPMPTLDAAEAARAVRLPAARQAPRPDDPQAAAGSDPSTPATHAGGDAVTERVIALALAGAMTDPGVAPTHRDVHRHRRPTAPAPLSRAEPAPPVVAAVAPVPAEAGPAEQPRHARDPIEETHRTLSLAAEQLASESAEQVAAAHAERVRVEVEAKRHYEAAERHALAADAAHAARAEAEAAALRAAQDREAAEARARELATSLAETRRQLLDQTRTILDGERTRAEQAARPAPVEEARLPVATKPGPEPRPEPELPPAAAPADSRIWPEGAEQTVRFRSRNSGAVLAVVLGLLALVAAGFTVYQAYRDRLTTTEGIVPAAVTVLLVIALGRTKSTSSAVWLTDGILHVETDDAHREFDLTNKQTLVQMIGHPDERRWKILLLRKGKPAYEIERSLVDPAALTKVLRRWRPEL